MQRSLKTTLKVVATLATVLALNMGVIAGYPWSDKLFH
jgi:hypothetical protein